MPAVYDAWRLAERFGYKHVRDFLRDHPNGADLTEMYAYLHRDDEVQIHRLIYAIMKAFNGDGKQPRPIDDDEEIIDTTNPDFAKHFQGFIGAPGQRP